MTDLTKLTAEAKTVTLPLEQWLDVVRRLERLEQCEAAIKERGIEWEEWSNAADALRGYWKVEDAARTALEE